MHTHLLDHILGCLLRVLEVNKCLVTIFINKVAFIHLQKLHDNLVNVRPTLLKEVVVKNVL